jgi:hypothetical protein
MIPPSPQPGKRGSWARGFSCKWSLDTDFAGFEVREPTSQQHRYRFHHAQTLITPIAAEKSSAVLPRCRISRPTLLTTPRADETLILVAVSG